MTKKPKTSVLSRPPTYEAEFRGRKIPVTVPDDPRGNPLEDALRDNLSPQALAAVAAHLFAANTRQPTVNRELRTFAEFLVNMVGKNEYSRLLEQVGL